MSTSVPQLKSFIEALLYNASTELVNNMENTKCLAEHKAECRFVKGIFLVMANMVNKLPSMTHSKATFNYKVLHPCFEATVNLLCHTFHPRPYYVPDEEPLEAMIQQLVPIGSKIDRRKVYNADGIIRLREFYDIEGSLAGDGRPLPE
ncbi:hypothetical protein BCV72DRAFT_332926 [Rhizopus microsporus var. microsporus]|uniref:Uncharacterized protein n=2 Tax=Rhizopus microsporus TaxID=58291 RepID=A0A2G4SG54_RHIZD|nr:uncharacterized protein RHIMIDRAFT_295734 [Rhizopus microsporus ATCC 52813]XP_023461823.1 uncharacterized protein RHIMIDRAFT_295320 [Rhizopus microsporus ATCC 52813]ORE10438.1 hypothetical protein BCV72DRAFT_332926 [Rhizopus microsporus var. microsporus]PHZ07751.1 hypothetical protein RHIMIDRAFT_295734 [Rhizopus microsporus ATCC 52813]PHZ08115.1 hypothetical protein RHIMIDRAFT_295320 [Rhizopus microsporus ATCC 52813]